ncbi:MAG: MotA/TolQ/ExbB proton channel family protein [Bacteroidetes bacterium]|nr:MotA/TolQ/ExbB proton channel family protein [Bacteroidota bacterium]
MINSILLQIATVQKDTLANAAGANGEAGEISLSVWDLTLKGGVIMIPILLLLIVAVYIFIERYMALRKASKEDSNFMNNIRDFIHNGKVDSALALCKSKESPVSRMIEKGVLRIGKPLNDINAAIENVGKVEVAKLEKNIGFLSTSAGAAPMIGFLGTVIGMIQAFFDMSQSSNNIDINLLSTGIYTAMVTTVAGLVVGIIAYICYNLLVSNVEKVVNKMETTTLEFMDLLQEPA